uniref:Putative secreted protein n=1 Tax=Ixodes ricinus TaxID=34613 RepID=A0A6B0V6S6_IXORI
MWNSTWLFFKATATFASPLFAERMSMAQGLPLHLNDCNRSTVSPIVATARTSSWGSSSVTVWRRFFRSLRSRFCSFFFTSSSVFSLKTSTRESVPWQSMAFSAGSATSEQILPLPSLMMLPNLVQVRGQLSSSSSSSLSFPSVSSGPTLLFLASASTAAPAASLSAICQTLSSLSALPVTNHESPLTSTKSQTSLRCPTSVLKQCCVARSQNLTNVSLELDTRMSLSLMKRHLVTTPLWPFSLNTPASLTTSHRMMTESLPPDARRPLSKSRLVTAALWPWKVMMASAWLMSKTLTAPSA